GVEPAANVDVRDGERATKPRGLVRAVLRVLTEPAVDVNLRCASRRVRSVNPAVPVSVKVAVLEHENLLAGCDPQSARAVADETAAAKARVDSPELAGRTQDHRAVRAVAIARNPEHFNLRGGDRKRTGWNALPRNPNDREVLERDRVDVRG